MKFYVSLRPLYLGETKIMPDKQLANAFKGLNMSVNILAYDATVDGRMVAEISLDPEYSDVDAAAYKDIIVEGMALFSCHIKTLESASQLITKITGCNCTISGDSLVVVPKNSL